jgi:hypothetical protein
MHLQTRTIHTGVDKDTAYNSIMTPIYQTSVFASRISASHAVMITPAPQILPARRSKKILHRWKEELALLQLQPGWPLSWRLFIWFTQATTLSAHTIAMEEQTVFFAFIKSSLAFRSAMSIFKKQKTFRRPFEDFDHDFERPGDCKRHKYQRKTSSPSMHRAGCRNGFVDCERKGSHKSGEAEFPR